MAMTALAPTHGVHLAYRHEAVGGHIGLSKTRLPFVTALDPYTVWRLSRMVQRLGISVLIPTKPVDVIAAGVTGRLCRIPTLARLGIVRRLGPYRRFAYETMADGVVVNAAAIKQVLQTDGYSRPERIHVIRNGLDTDALEDALKRPALSRPLAGAPRGRRLPIADAARPPSLESLAHDLRIAPSADVAGHTANPSPHPAAAGGGWRDAQAVGQRFEKWPTRSIADQNEPGVGCSRQRMKVREAAEQRVESLSIDHAGGAGDRPSGRGRVRRPFQRVLQGVGVESVADHVDPFRARVAVGL